MRRGCSGRLRPLRNKRSWPFDKSEKALEDAKANLEEGRHDATILLAYMSLLSASKAILFNDGIREKSHVCIVRYLETEHIERLGSQTIKLLDSFREERHEVQYSASFRATELQAKEIVEFAGEFLAKAEKIVKG